MKTINLKLGGGVLALSLVFSSCDKTEDIVPNNPGSTDVSQTNSLRSNGGASEVNYNEYDYNEYDDVLDRLTGGGWIIAPSAEKGSFAVGGGIKNGNYWGHLNFIDHGVDGPKIKGLSVTGYIALTPTSRKITGICKINGAGSYDYTVIVTDNGEPGTNDYFSLSTNGYTASGILQGGNIQLHK